MTDEREFARWREAAAYARREAAQVADASLRHHWREIAESYDRLMRSATAEQLRQEAGDCDRRARDAESIPAERTDAD